MLTYDDIVASLEDAWVAVGLHEHSLVESVIPASHDRNYRVELFPEHPEPLTLENMPPWVEVGFTWSALHQIRSERRDIVATPPLDLIWTYTVQVYGMPERSDQELVRLFRKVFHRVFQRFYPDEAAEMEPMGVEVRRIYQGDNQRLLPVYTQLLSTNLTDLSDQWDERDPRVLPELIRMEVQFASALLYALRDAFNPGGHGGYRSVDTA